MGFERLHGSGAARWREPVFRPRPGAGSEPRSPPQRCVPQDTGFSSLFLKVLMQMLQWLDGPAGEGGPLQAQLKLFAAQYSARRRVSDGEGAGLAATAPGAGGEGR